LLYDPEIPDEEVARLKIAQGEGMIRKGHIPSELPLHFELKEDIPYD
jgi:hypothetical protein